MSNSFYDQLVASDIVEKVAPLLNSGSFRINLNGRIEPVMPSGDWASPWIFTRKTSSRMCLLWKDIFNEAFGLLPTDCAKCWKVVVRPRSLVELFALQGVMKQLNLSSKLGIELRETVPALYGAYFYNDSLESGRNCYRVVRDAVSSEISPDIKVILKRGCTELEHQFGPSDQWDNLIKPGQDQIEKKIEALFDIPVENPQPDFAKINVMRRWIEFAYKNGDPTYSEFTGGRPLYPDYVSYHEVPKEPEIAEPVSKPRAVAEPKRRR